SSTRGTSGTVFPSPPIHVHSLTAELLSTDPAPVLRYLLPYRHERRKFLLIRSRRPRPIMKVESSHLQYSSLPRYGLESSPRPHRPGTEGNTTRCGRLAGGRRGSN